MSATGTVAATQSSAAGANAQQYNRLETELGKDQFLQLLITELRYQDPMNPMQDREFISQMAQFSSLEQMQNLNKTMETGLASLNETQEMLGLGYIEILNQLTGYLAYGSLNMGLNLLGREVTYLLDGEETTGVVSAIKQKNGQFLALIGENEVPLYEINLIK